jgi:cytochrome P450
LIASPERAFAPRRQRVIYLLPAIRSVRSNRQSTQTVTPPAINFTPPKRNSLTHIPGDEGWPIIGKTLDVLADPKGRIERSAAKYGLVYRSHHFGETSLVLLGPDANELVLFDQAKQFSSSLGWGQILGLLFPRGLMLLDFEEHRLHRRALSVAFKSGPMKSFSPHSTAASRRGWRSGNRDRDRCCSIRR